MTAERVRRRSGIAAAFLLALAPGACSDAAGDRGFAHEATASCQPVEAIGELPGVLLEASGITRDPRRADLFWVHNDSGNPAELIAVGARARLLGIAPVDGASNRDIEDIAVGACPEGTCLYLADIGDNLAVHSTIYVHRLPLPEIEGLAGGSDPGAPTGTARDGDAPRLPAVRPDGTWRFVYPAGPRDAESLAVDSERGELIVVTKGREGLIELYAASISDPGTGTASEAPDTLRRVGRLPLPIGENTGQFVTAADLSPDGTRLAVRSYTTLYQFDWPGAAAFDTLAEPDHAPLLGALEAQGEGVAWEGGGEALFLVSEGRGNRPPSLSRIHCPAS